MSPALKYSEQEIATTMEDNQKVVREMVMESFQDMKEGKGRDYKDFFNELEGRYQNINV